MDRGAWSMGSQSQTRLSMQATIDTAISFLVYIKIIACSNTSRAIVFHGKRDIVNQEVVWKTSDFLWVLEI